MLTIAYYFLQVILCSGLLMGYYLLVLRNKRFHQYNRFYLLAAALLAWIVPLIKISWSKPIAISEQPQVIQFLSVLADNNTQIENNLSAPVVSATVVNPAFVWNWNLFAVGLYIFISAFLLSGMLRAFFRLYRLLKMHSCKNVGDVFLVFTHAKGTPFSFFRYIFWNEEIDLRSETGQQILQHELTHVQQKHSFDKIFIQLTLIAGWFNPFFWMMRREMDMIHEFIADKKAVNNGDTASLAQMLLTAAYPNQQFALTNPFFFSPIKRRLKMLTNTKNPRFSYIRRLIVLPLLAMVVVLFAFRTKEQREGKTLSVASVVENVVNEISDKLKSPDEKNSPPFTNAALTRPYVVVIDAGHGGTDKGVLATDGTTESQLTLELARLIQQQNDNPDIHIVLTRDADIDETNEKRADIANSNHSDLFVSLHYNAVASTQPGNKDAWSGAQFFIPSKESPAGYEQSFQFAKTVSEAMNTLDEKTRSIQTRQQKKIFVLETVQSPAVLIDPGFISNTAYIAKLKNKVYEKQLAAAILQGINQYLLSLGDTNAVFARDTTIPSKMPPAAGAAQWKIDTKGLPIMTYRQVLYILDGQTIDYNTFANINPNNIASINVWKNADAVAKYGEQGKNGVVEIISKDNPIHFGKDGSGKVVIHPTKPLEGQVPLYVLDRKPQTGMNWNINPGDIDKIDVLKGKDATDKYGDVAKDGVIEITTKSFVRGTLSAATVNVKVNHGVDLIIEPQSTSVATIIINGVKKGDPILVTPQSDYKDWAIYSAWVAGDDTVKVRFYNYTDRQIKVLGEQYKIVVLQGESAKISAISENIVAQNVPHPDGISTTKGNTFRETETGTGTNNPIVVNGYPRRTEPGIKVTGHLIKDTARNVPITVTGYPLKKKTEDPSNPHDAVTKNDDRGILAARSVPLTVTGHLLQTNPRSASDLLMEDIPASFPGGMEAWSKYLNRNLDLGIPSKNGAKPGKYTVVVSFIISTEGELSSIAAENDPGYGTKNEAERVIKSGPRWVPAQKDGKNVRSFHKQSISFTVSTTGTIVTNEPITVSNSKN